MQFCNHQSEHVDTADVWYPVTDTPNNPTVRQSVSRMIGKPLTEVWALLSITKHSIHSLDSAHYQWIRPNVFARTRTERGGGANVFPACADNHKFYLQYTSVYPSNDNRLENLWVRLQLAQGLYLRVCIDKSLGFYWNEVSLVCLCHICLLERGRWLYSFSRMWPSASSNQPR